MSGGYVGRFAPSPTGLLHAGSLVAALASWLDARAHGGRWLLRLEDVDTPRCVPGAGAAIVRQLDACALRPDAPPSWQSAHTARYALALAQLVDAGRAYPCGCTRRDLARALADAGAPRARFGELRYPGTCRDGLPEGRAARAWRLRVGDGGAAVAWCDRRLGAQTQDVAQAVGDFVLKRADGLWAYQLAVVVDDAADGITDVVRGEDLADNTARQIVLQRALGVATPRHLHTPLVLAADGHKLSKQNGAQPLALDGATQSRAALGAAAHALALPPAAPSATVAEALAAWVAAWRDRWAHGRAPCAG